MASTIIQQVVREIKHNNYSLLYKSKTHLLAKTQEGTTLLGLHSSHQSYPIMSISQASFNLSSLEHTHSLYSRIPKYNSALKLLENQPRDNEPKKTLSNHP
jgi:hypothetical protein